MTVTRTQKAKNQMDLDSDPYYNQTWNMNTIGISIYQSRNRTLIRTYSNRLPSIEETQTGLTQEEIEATQLDPQVLMIINVLINNNRDKYLSLLIQNGAKIPPNFDISTITPPGVTLNLDAT